MGGEDELFSYLEDLEAQAAALYDAERAPALADRSRAEYAGVTLASRLAASTGLEVTLEVAGAGSVAGRLVRVARGWCRLRGPGHEWVQDWVVLLDAVLGVHGASERAVPEVAWPAAARLGVGAALRGLAERLEPCSLLLTDGSRHDGVVRRVGADFVEVATGEPSRTVLVAHARLAAVRSRHPA